MGKGMEVGNYNPSKDDNNNGPRKKINNWNLKKKKLSEADCSP